MLRLDNNWRFVAQEVDHFHLLERVLGAQGYEGFFLPKPDSPCIYLPDNSGPDGCALFYLKSKFQLVEQHKRILEVWRVQSNQVGLIPFMPLLHIYVRIYEEKYIQFALLFPCRKCLHNYITFLKIIQI